MQVERASLELTLKHSQALSTRGHTYAAWENLQAIARREDLLSPSLRASLMDELGIACIQLGEAQMASMYFTQASTTDLQDPSINRYLMHLALMYRRDAELDKAQRLLVKILEESNDAKTPLPTALLLGNLGIVQGYENFHEEALSHSLRSLALLEESGEKRYLPDVLTNIGVHYASLENWSAAEEYFQHALLAHEGFYLPPLVELCRLHYTLGDYEESISCATQLLDHVWSSGFGIEKEEIARLCELLASLAWDLGQKDVARRLLEKAQLFFGQLRMWREWQSSEAILERWQSARNASLPLKAYSSEAWRLRDFVTLLDAVQAQELIHTHFSALLDTRVQYASLLADSMQVSAQDKQSLIYACRFADYGLTVLEPEIVLDPHRSLPAWERYKGHPELSIRLLESVHLPTAVQAIIAAHHERYDRTGFPRGLAQETLPLGAAIFATADYYATGVAFSRMPHSEVCAHMIEERQHALHPTCVDHFLSLFHVSDSD